MDQHTNNTPKQPPKDTLFREQWFPTDIWFVDHPTAEKTNQKLINVFVPTTPNPTSGFLLMFPIDDVIYLNMTFEEASKFIVSAGTSTGKN